MNSFASDDSLLVCAKCRSRCYARTMSNGSRVYAHITHVYDLFAQIRNWVAWASWLRLPSHRVLYFDWTLLFYFHMNVITSCSLPSPIRHASTSTWELFFHLHLCVELPVRIAGVSSSFMYQFCYSVRRRQQQRNARNANDKRISSGNCVAHRSNFLWFVTVFLTFCSRYS